LVDRHFGCVKPLRAVASVRKKADTRKCSDIQDIFLNTISK
jgi:hypothetical protein